MQQKLSSKEQELHYLQNSYSQHSVEKKLILKKDEVVRVKKEFEQSVNFKIQNYAKELEEVKNRFPFIIESVLNLAQNQVIGLQKMLESNNPKFKTKKGFAQLSQNDKVIDISLLNVDDSFELQSDEIIINAKVLQKENIK
jgi:exodeoxyribonuclease VII large subunit